MVVQLAGAALADFNPFPRLLSCATDFMSEAEKKAEPLEREQFESYVEYFFEVDVAAEGEEAATSKHLSPSQPPVT